MDKKSWWKNSTPTVDELLRKISEGSISTYEAAYTIGFYNLWSYSIVKAQFARCPNQNPDWFMGYFDGHGDFQEKL